jgi:hypothetical protein
MTALVLAWNAPVAEASTLITPGKVTEITTLDQPLPILPAPADGRIAGYGFFARVTGDECAAAVGDPGAQLRAAAGDDVCAFDLDLSYVISDFESDLYNTPAPFSASVLVGSRSLPIAVGSFVNTT